MNLFRWCNQHPTAFRFMLWWLSLSPGLYLYWRFFSDRLGFNLFETLMATTGTWALVFYLLSLAITPLRRWLCFLCRLTRRLYGKRLSDWNFLIRSRRQIGLYSFFYACWHLGIYLHLEMDWYWPDIFDDIKIRWFLALGITAWAGLLLLSMSSPSVIQRKMGRQWRRLHRMTYFIAIVVVLHIWLEAKLIGSTEWLYLSLVVILLGHRLLTRIKRWRRTDDTGMEAIRRQ